jgi:hypothetical protein
MADTRRELTALQTLFADNSSGLITAQDGRDELISSHPSKTFQSGAYASFPTSPVTGDEFQTETLRWIYTGSLWVPSGPIFQFTDPTIPTFSWLNQGSATVTTTNGGICLDAPSNGTSWTPRVRYITAPATPYTITIAFLCQVDPSAGAGNQGQAGLLMRDSSTPRSQSISVNMLNGSTTPFEIEVDLNGDTSYVSTQVERAWACRSPVAWLRCQDDGANRIFSTSADGINFITVLTTGRTSSSVTANQVGFYVNPYSIRTQMTLLSWKQT